MAAKGPANYLVLTITDVFYFNLFQIHLFTSGSHTDQALGHFSVTETDLIRHPENYNQVMLVL